MEGKQDAIGFTVILLTKHDQEINQFELTVPTKLYM